MKSWYSGKAANLKFDNKNVLQQILKVVIGIVNYKIFKYSFSLVPLTSTANICAYNMSMSGTLMSKQRHVILTNRAPKKEVCSFRSLTSPREWCSVLFSLTTTKSSLEIHQISPIWKKQLQASEQWQRTVRVTGLLILAFSLWKLSSTPSQICYEFRNFRIFKPLRFYLLIISLHILHLQAYIYIAVDILNIHYNFYWK
jgi:hypothetical protein